MRVFASTLGSMTQQVIAVTMLACGLAGPVAAQAQGSTIERIKQTGTIKIGYGTTPPFSFLDDRGNVVGYSIDLCNALAKEISITLGMSDIHIDYVPRTASNRVQLLNDGHIDIECNASSNTAERRKAAAFSPPHFIAQTRFVSLKKNSLKKLEDLRGKTVSVVLGTVNVGQILQSSRDMKLGLAPVQVNDVQAAFELVKNGTVSAFAMDDILLASMIADSGSPQDYQLSEEGLGEPAPYGFMTRVDDTAFAALVADRLTEIYRRPQMIEIYDKWFMQPIRDGRYTLNVPMSPTLRSAMGLSR